MLPRVVEEQLAENCDVFCERGYFDITESEKILRAAQEQGLRLRMHVDQLTNSGGAFLAARLRAATADHLEQVNAAEITRAGGSGSAARPVARFGLLVRQDALPAGPGNDRGWPRGCARHGLQSRFVAHAVDADDPIAGGDADEDDAGGMHDRGDHQRRLQLESRRQDRLARAGQAGEFRALRLRRIIARSRITLVFY